MSTPVHAILSGSFTSDGNEFTLSLPSGYNEVELVNITDIGSTAAATPVMKAKGTSSMAAGSAYVSLKTNAAATIALESGITTLGFTFVADSGAVSLGASLPITALTAANPAVASAASTAGLSNGDIVRLYSPTGMLQAGGIDYSIGGLVANTSFQLSNLDASGFAAPATGGSVRKVFFNPRYYPRARFITKITQAASAVVTTSIPHGYTAGQLVRINCPSAFGMSQINGLLGTITAVTASTFTVNIDSSAFTPFAFPTSAVAGSGVTQAQVVPVGEAASGSYANLLDDATLNQAVSGVIIGTGVQTSGKLYQWIAKKGVSL